MRKKLWLRHCFVFMFSLLVSILHYLLSDAFQADRLKSFHTTALFESTSLLNTELGGLSDLALILATSETLQKSNTQSNNTHELTEKQQADIAQYFINFAQASSNISQIRWLNASGLEQVRVDVGANQANVVNEAALQNKSERYYFQRSMQIVNKNGGLCLINLPLH